MLQSVGEASAKEFKAKAKLDVKLDYDTKHFLPEDWFVISCYLIYFFLILCHAAVVV